MKAAIPKTRDGKMAPPDVEPTAWYRGPTVGASLCLTSNQLACLYLRPKHEQGQTHLGLQLDDVRFRGIEGMKIDTVVTDKNVHKADNNTKHRQLVILLPRGTVSCG